MRKLICMIMCMGMLTIWSTAIAGGIGILYSGSAGDLVDSNILTVGYYSNDGLTFSFFVSGATGAEIRKENTSNYKKTTIDDAYGMDIGWRWQLAKHLRLGVEGSIGWATEYDKYQDRSTGDNYLVDKGTSELFGIGATIGIPVFDWFEIMCGIHTFKGVGGGGIINF